MNNSKLQKYLNQLYKDLSYVDMERGTLKTLMLELSQISNTGELIRFKKARNADIKLAKRIKAETEPNDSQAKDHLVNHSVDGNKETKKAKKPEESPVETSTVKKLVDVYYKLNSRSTEHSANTDNSRSFYIIWDDIIFEKDKVRFSPNRINAILPSLEFKGIFEELNSLKLEYFKRLFDKDVYKLTFKRNRLQIDKSPDWKRITDTIEIGKQYFHFKTNGKSSFGPKLTTGSIVKLYNNAFERNQYLKFLASIQHDSFKLIPIIESINGQKEESFIFRIQTKGNKILVVWENVNEKRATHIFINLSTEHEKDLQKLESFICTPMKTKRVHLYINLNNSLSLREELNYLRPIRHTTLHSYEEEILNVIKTH